MSLSNSSAIRKSLPKATCGSIPKYKFHFNRINKSILNFTASQNLLSDPDSKWSLDPERGLTLKNTTIGDTGQYQCVGTMNNNTDWEYFQIYVKGVTQFDFKKKKKEINFYCISNLKNQKESNWKELAMRKIRWKEVTSL